MKNRYFFALLILVVALAGCDNNPVRPSSRPELPVLPAHWEETLGEAHWRLEWVSEDGAWQTAVLDPSSRPPAISLNGEWTTPVLAWPFWPEKNLLPGMMQPSGGLFPWDASGDRLTLSWLGGVEAGFWKELAEAERQAEVPEVRLPWNFDWNRFRMLLGENGSLPVELREDPWLADWKEIGRKTIQSGFDSRRIVSKEWAEISVPGLGGRWINSSPFVPPLDVPEGASLALRAGSVPETWVSSMGILKCSASGWVFIPGSEN